MTEITKAHPFKSHQMPLAMRLFFSTMTITFKVLESISTKLAGKLALHLFMSPPKFGTPNREKKLRQSAKLSHLNFRGNKISIRSWGEQSAPAVLLSHGWGGRCTQLHAFIPVLIEAGYRVVGFDLAGHGDSTGKYSNMLEGAALINEVSNNEGPFEAIIGHSFGCATTLLSLDKFHVETPKVILMAGFSDVFWVTRIFGELFTLKEATIEAMRHLAEKKFASCYGISWNWKQISPEETIKRVKSDILIIHDTKDLEVPYSQAVTLQKSAIKAKLLTTSGYGHRKILMNKQCIDTVVAFIKE